MVLLRARPHPAPLRPPARRKAARDEPHRTAAGKPDVHLAARGQVATRGDEPLTGEQAKRVVHRRGLDDAVQVEPRPALQHQHTPVQLDCPSAKGGPERRRARLQPGEVAVVPGRLERCAHGRVDEAAGLLARPQPPSTIRAKTGERSRAPEPSLTAFSSLSGRKRLKRASRSSKSVRTRVTSSPVAPSTTTSHPMDVKRFTSVPSPLTGRPAQERGSRLAAGSPARCERSAVAGRAT